MFGEYRRRPCCAGATAGGGEGRAGAAGGTAGQGGPAAGRPLQGQPAAVQAAGADQAVRRRGDLQEQQQLR